MLLSKPIWFKQFVRHCSGCLMKVKILHFLCSLQLLLVLLFVIWSQKALNLLVPNCFIGHCAIASNSECGNFFLDWSSKVSVTFTRVAVISAYTDRLYSAGDGNGKDPQMTNTAVSCVRRDSAVLVLLQNFSVGDKEVVTMGLSCALTPRLCWAWLCRIFTTISFL